MLSLNLTIKSFHKIFKTHTICKLGEILTVELLIFFQSSRRYSGPMSPDPKSVFQSDLNPTNWRRGWRHTITIYWPPQKLNIKQKVSWRRATVPLEHSDPDASWGHQLKVNMRSPLDHISICIFNESSSWAEPLCLYTQGAKFRTNSCNVP